jgi:hypothetical protein
MKQKKRPRTLKMNREQVTGRPAIDELSIEARVKSSTEKNLLRVKSYESRLHDYHTDPAKAVRISEFNCRVCYYIDAGIATQGFVKCKCEHCSTEFFWGNGHVPNICRDCGIKYQACLWCYGDIHS